MFTVWTQNTEGLLIKLAAATVAELMLCAVAARLTMLSRPDCWMRSRKMTFSQCNVKVFRVSEESIVQVAHQGGRVDWRVVHGKKLPLKTQ